MVIARTEQNKSAKDRHILSLLRTLPFQAMCHNSTVSLKHLPGRENSIADAISRKQLYRFFSLSPQTVRTPTPPLAPWSPSMGSCNSRFYFSMPWLVQPKPLIALVSNISSNSAPIIRSAPCQASTYFLVHLSKSLPQLPSRSTYHR